MIIVDLMSKEIMMVNFDDIARMALGCDEWEYRTTNGWISFSPQDMPLRHLINLCREYPVRRKPT